MTESLEMALDNLRGAVIDGRTRNIRYRQNEMQNLHALLRRSSDDICDAIKKDDIGSIEVVEREFFLAMDSIRQSYDSLNFDRSLREEYYIQYGEDNLTNLVEFGLVVLRPGRYSRFYSIVTPLAAAIAAGNCLLLELEPSLSHVDALLKKLLPTGLCHETFAISSAKLSAKESSHIDLLVDQTSTDVTSIPYGLLSPCQARTVAVVDRTGMLQDAARVIVTAHLSAGSPYASDFVIVHEAVNEKFRIACLEYANSIPMASRRVGTLLDHTNQDVKKALSKEQAAGKVKVHTLGPANLNIVEILDRTSLFMTMKLSRPYIVFLPSTSLVDTVDSQRSSPKFLASYLFAAPGAAKFLSEQIDSRVSYINQIPQELLIGPASPTSLIHSLHPRYTPEMFSQPKPQRVKPSTTLSTSVHDQLKAALQPLDPVNQPLGRAVGFFEQGIFIGLGVTFFVVLPGLSYAAFRGVKYGIGRLGK